MEKQLKIEKRFITYGKNTIFNEKRKRGGKRAGAGRPKKSETKTVSFRVELKHIEPIKELVNNYLKNK